MDMDAWSRTDVFEFFACLSIHEERIKKKIDAINGNRH